MCNLIQYILNLANAYAGKLVCAYDCTPRLRIMGGLFGHQFIHPQSLSAKKIILTNRAFGAESTFAPETGNTRRCAWMPYKQKQVPKIKD